MQWVPCRKIHALSFMTQIHCFFSTAKPIMHKSLCRQINVEIIEILWRKFPALLALSLCIHFYIAYISCKFMHIVFRHKFPTSRCAQFMHKLIYKTNPYTNFMSQFRFCIVMHTILCRIHLYFMHKNSCIQFYAPTFFTYHEFYVVIFFSARKTIPPSAFRD